MRNTKTVWFAIALLSASMIHATAYGAGEESDSSGVTAADVMGQEDLGLTAAPDSVGMESVKSSKKEKKGVKKINAQDRIDRRSKKIEDLAAKGNPRADKIAAKLKEKNDLDQKRLASAKAVDEALVAVEGLPLGTEAEASAKCEGLKGVKALIKEKGKDVKIKPLDGRRSEFEGRMKKVAQSVKKAFPKAVCK